VQVKLIASNIKGSSLTSNAGAGAIIITEPNAPHSLSEVTSDRSVSTLGL
jgi:hypothetical protein